METFGERLRRLRGARGLSVNQFAKLVRKDPGGISRIENGKRLVGTLPAYHDLVLWAEVLGVEVGELAGGVPQEAPPPRRPLTDDELLDKIGARPYDPIDLIEGVAASAGPGSGIPQDIDDTIPRRRRNKRYDRLKEVTVIGRCMEPELFPGDVVIIDRERVPISGKVVVAVRDEQELLIKRFVARGDVQYLVSNDGREVAIDERLRILGPVLAYQRSMW